MAHFNLVSKFSKINQANVLKVAAVAIAAPRYMGAFAVAIGIDALKQYPLLAHAEVLSGGAMALLEGFAVAFVLSKWRKLKPASASWFVLLTFAILLAATLPLVAAPYLLIEQDSSTAQALFANHRLLQIAWSILVAGVPMLVIMAVGFADVELAEAELAQFEPKSANFEPVSSAEVQAQLASSAQAQLKLSCSACSKTFISSKALCGHKAHCRAKANGKLPEMEVVTS